MRRASFHQRARKQQGTGRRLRRCLICWGPIRNVTALTSPSWVTVDTAFISFSTRASFATRSTAVAFATRLKYRCVMVLSKLLMQLVKVGNFYPQVALFCLGNVVASTLQAFVREALQFFDNDTHHWFSDCAVIDTLNPAWQ